MLMDEPFGATDPITREQLQNEFLRLQRELRKTIVFVTHDFDEAIKLGDRIAVLRPRSEIAQYDTPRPILARSGRRLRRELHRRRRSVEEARAPSTPRHRAGAAATRADGLPQLSIDGTLRDALNLMLERGSEPGRSSSEGAVDDSRVLGSLDLATVMATVSGEKS